MFTKPNYWPLQRGDSDRIRSPTIFIIGRRNLVKIRDEVETAESKEINDLKQLPENEVKGSEKK